MRYILIMLIGVALITGCSKQKSSAVSNWTPPQNPNPQEILRDAEADASDGNYANALAKHIWFFQNALRYDSGEYGVRLSFALSDWVELGKIYPLALEKLKTFRDEAETNVREEKNVRDNFSDFESINGKFKEDAKTVQLFIWLDSDKPDSAKMVFDLAEPALIKSRQYRLCGKYIDNPKVSYNRSLNLYRKNMEIAQKPGHGGKDLQNFAEKKFANETTTLIALLIVDGRKTDAQQIADTISKEPNLPEFKDEIQKALNGEVPTPWPSAVVELDFISEI
jgi:hypothetical protein